MAAPMITTNILNLCRSFAGFTIRRSFTYSVKSPSHLIKLTRVKENGLPFLAPAKKCIGVTSIHTSAAYRDLSEFFDKKENWSEPAVRVGRPYRMDELRLKSNADLHKLWYVLLKERNMLMTMDAEYKRQNELFPNPERLEKVEDSMENLLDVVKERDTALSLLETGEIPPQCRKRWAYNELGIGYWRKYQEYHVPLYMNKRFRRSTMLSGRWQLRYIRLYREQKLRQRRKAIMQELSRVKKLRSMFPHAEVEPNLEEFEKTMAKTSMHGPQSYRAEGEEGSKELKTVGNS